MSYENKAQTVIDIDGNVYQTVIIGKQKWMAENLRVTHYRNGDLIPNIKSDSIWFSFYDTNIRLSGRCYYNNDSTTNSSIYGALYNYFAVVDIRGIAPVGWHVPNINEWIELSTYLGGDNIAGGKLKEIGNAHWVTPNEEGTNESGFTALPGGQRQAHKFNYLASSGFWWSTTIASSHWPWSYVPEMKYNSTSISTNSAQDWCNGISIRLINDTLIGNPIVDPTSSNIVFDSFNNTVNIYPIPAFDRLTIDCHQLRDVHFTIYNIFGELVLQKIIPFGTSDIDISDIDKGIYIVKVSDGFWIVQKKLIKQ